MLGIVETVRSALGAEDAGGGKRVVAYVVSDAPVDIKAMNAFIEEELPSYMVPSATMQIDRIPLNQNGKARTAGLAFFQCFKTERRAGQCCGDGPSFDRSFAGFAIEMLIRCVGGRLGVVHNAMTMLGRTVQCVQP